MSANHLATELRRIIPADRVASDPEELLVYGYDGTWLDRLPDAVVSVTSAEEVADVLHLASRLGVPVVPRGAGTGLAGGAVPHEGGIVLNTTLMHRIKTVDPVDRVAIVEPGVVNADLQAAAEARGMFYPPDPASMRQATIGGNIATSASGPRCLKYGGTKDYLLGLEVVVPSGEILRLGGCSHEPCGPTNVVQLFVGSEGTLGVVTEATLRLIAKPEARTTVMAAFARLEDASSAVLGLLESGITPLALEMMDQVTIHCVEAYLHAGLPVEAEAMLLIDVDGDRALVAAESEVVASHCRANGGDPVRVAATDVEAELLWRARRAVSSSFGRLRPNKLGEDISVPRAAIPEAVRRIQTIARECELHIPLFGHIGDGNLHPNILCDLRDRAEMERVKLAAQAIFAAAVELGGTLSGEHGIGLLKKEFLGTGLDGEAIDLMRSIKATFDPKNILNPSKLFPTA